MSLLTQAFLMERYGSPRLNVEQLAQVLGCTEKTIYNNVSSNTLGLRTYADKGKRYADVRDVAEYFDRVREAVS